MFTGTSWEKKNIHLIFVLNQFDRTRNEEGTSTALAELAKGEYLDIAHGKMVFCASLKKAVYSV